LHAIKDECRSGAKGLSGPPRPVPSFSHVPPCEGESDPDSRLSPGEVVVPTKSFLASKSIWLGATSLLAGLASVLFCAARQGALPASWEPYLLVIGGIAGIVLRFRTNIGVHVMPDETPGPSPAEAATDVPIRIWREP